MNAQPVILRELRAEARNPFSYWLRLLGAGAVIAAFAFLILSQGRITPQAGAWLFYELNSTLFFAVMVFAPMLTADCISREHREGTLGLLFLTPLTAQDIVVGKSLIHAVRAFTLVVAALPILALPFVLGGVTGRAVIHTAGFHLSGLLLALAAGLLATSRNVEWIRAVVVAEMLSGIFTVALLYLPRFHAVLVSSSRIASSGHAVLFRLWRYSDGIVLVLAALVFVWAVRQAGRQVQATWQADATAFAPPRWVNVFSGSEFWRSVFRWDKGRTLDRNPIAWLQEYSWTARLTKWGWCLLVLALEIVVLTDISTPSFLLWQTRLTMLLGIGLAFSAVASFHKERQTGALELLLVTPLRTTDLIRGRLWGLWGHFFPAFAILLLCWVFAPFEHLPRQRNFSALAFTLYLTLPIIGMCFASLRINFFVSWLLTCGVGVALPFTSANYMRRWFWLMVRPHLPGGLLPNFDFVFFGAICALEVVVAVGALVLLQRNLRRRTFAVHASGSS